MEKLMRSLVAIARTYGVELSNRQAARYARDYVRDLHRYGRAAAQMTIRACFEATKQLQA